MELLCAIVLILLATIGTVYQETLSWAIVLDVVMSTNDRPEKALI